MPVPHLAGAQGEKMTETMAIYEASEIIRLYQKLRPLLLPPTEPSRKQIGFGVKERRARYRVAGKPRP
jgi:hypothetical protein